VIPPRLDQVLVHPLRDAAEISYLIGHSVPDNLANFFSDLLNGIHSPEDVEMLIFFDDLRVYNSDMRLEASFEAL
jgi:hypothetical protein